MTFVPIDPSLLDEAPAGGARREGPAPWQTPLPPGRHVLRVRQARLHQSARSGNTTAYVQLEGETPEGATAWVDAYLGLASRGLVHALRALGLTDAVRAAGGLSDDLLAQAVGRWVEVTTANEPDERTGGERSRVRYWEGPAEAPADAGEPRTAATLDRLRALARGGAAPAPPPPPAPAAPPTTGNPDLELAERVRALPATHRADDAGRTGVEPEKTTRAYLDGAWVELSSNVRDYLSCPF